MLAQKTLTAVKTQQAPAIDGKLDDDVWQSAPLATDFVQSFHRMASLLQQKQKYGFYTTIMRFTSVHIYMIILP